MKKILLLIVLLASFLVAQEKAIQVYIKVLKESVKLKWIPKEYSSENNYKLYKNDVLIATLKPKAYEDLVRDKYSEDYIFVIYPFRNVKNLDEQILAYKAEQKAGGFRVLRLMQDNTFAKNLGQFYEDKIQNDGAKIEYRLEFFKNKKKIAIKHLTVKPQKISNIDAVSVVYAKNTSNGVSLNWDSKNSYAFYNIYRKLEGENKFSKITKRPMYKSPATGTKGSVAFEDGGLKKGQKATYYVTKFDIFYEESEPSKEVQAQRLLYQKPPIVKNIFVKNTDNKISLRWSKIDKINGYNVYRSTNYNGGYKKINKDPIKEEAYFDRDFRVGQNYYYYVTSLNQHGESFASTKMLAYARDVTPPGIPSNLIYKLDGSNVALHWDKTAQSDLAGYRVYMSMDAEAKSWSLINKELIKEPNFVHNRAKTLSRNNYYYHVRAVDTSFNESAMSNIITVKLPDVTPPMQPTLTKTMAYPFKITLEWDKTLVYDFSHYNVYKKDGTKLNTAPLLRNYFEDTNPQSGINEYIITAVDTSGNESSKEKIQSVILSDTLPLKIEKVMISKNSKGVQISFTCSDKQYNGFEVFRSNGKDPKYYNISSFLKTKSFLDTNPSKTSTNFYLIKAYHKSGNIAQSEVLSIDLKNTK